MKACFFVALIVLVSLTRNGVGADICESCLCEPNDAPVSVTCKCKTPETVLDFKPQDFSSKFKNTRNFTVSNCENMISFKQNLFRELHNLENLEVQDVKQVAFEMGVFQTLNHLKLRNIDNLNFKSNAFHGGQLKSVEIHQSNIGDLPQYAFHDISSLEKFVLSDVHISNVQTNAIMLKDNNAVEIVNATIDKISSNAMNIEAASVIIYKSALNEMSPAALNITVKNQFVISQTEFKEVLPDNPIISMAPIVNVSRNYFKHLTPQVMKNMKGKSDGNFIFADNAIENIESQTPLSVPSSTWDIRGNIFKCSCEMLRLFDNLKGSDFLVKNYCKLSICRVTLSESEDKCAKESPADLDDTDLCEGVSTEAPIQPRVGKVPGLYPEEENNHQITTHMPMVRTPPSSSASISLVSIISFWSFIALKLV